MSFCFWGNDEHCRSSLMCPTQKKPFPGLLREALEWRLFQLLCVRCSRPGQDLPRGAIGVASNCGTYREYLLALWVSPYHAFLFGFTLSLSSSCAQNQCSSLQSVLPMPFLSMWPSSLTVYLKMCCGYTAPQWAQGPTAIYCCRGEGCTILLLLWGLLLE